MIDIDKWGPPPPITDNVNHGDLLKVLNELGFKVQINDAVYTTRPQEVLDQVIEKVTDYLPEVKSLVESHTLRTGVTHGETKQTTGLGKKDNFRMATIDECKSFANVNAFVHPAGVSAALEGLTIDLAAEYQQNDIFPIAVLTNQSLFQHVPLSSALLSTVTQGPGYVGKYRDALTLIPRQNQTSNGVYTVFKGFKSTAGVNNRFYDTGGIKYCLSPQGENPQHFVEQGKSQETRYLLLDIPNQQRNDVVKFIPNKTPAPNGILGGTNRAQTRNFYFGTEYWGDGTATEIVISHGVWSINTIGNTFTPFTVTWGVDGQGNPLFDGSVLTADFLRINLAKVCISNDPNVALFVEKKVVSLCWEVLDKTYIVKINGKVRHQNNATGKKFFFNFSLSLRATIVHSAALGKIITYTPVFAYPATVVNENNLSSINTGYTRLFEREDPLDTVLHPGVIIEDGLFVRLQTYQQHSYVHYTKFNDVSTVLEYFKTPINALEGSVVNTMPLAHTGLSPFGNTPQRVIPLEYSDAGFKVASFGLDNSVGGFSWSLLTWLDKTLATPRTSFKAPDLGSRLNLSKAVPSSITSIVNDNNVSYHGLNFVSCNSYVGLAGLQFENDGFKSTGEITLNPVNLVTLFKLEDAFLARAKTYYNNTAVERHQSFDVAVFTLGNSSLTTKNNALIMLSDGFGYLEYALANYSVVNGIYTITSNIAALTYYPIAHSSKPTNFIGDVEREGTYKILSTFSDMTVYEHADGKLNVSFNRPWGDHRIGKVTLNIQNYNPTDLTMGCSYRDFQAVKLVGKTTSVGTLLTANQLVDVYQPQAGNLATDFLVVDSVPFDACDTALPGKGLYCNRGDRSSDNRLTRHTLMGATGTFGAVVEFDLIQLGDVVVPSGFPVVLGGRAMKPHRDISFNVESNNGWNKYYLKRDNLDLSIVKSPNVVTDLEPRSDLIEIARYDEARSSIVLNENELTINGVKMSHERIGSAFPISSHYDPTDKELYKFFYYNDAPHYPPRFEVDLPSTKTVYATQNGAYSVDLYSRVPPVTVDWYVQKPGNTAVKITDKVATTALGNHVYRSQINYSFEHWDLTNSKIWCEAFDERPESTLSTVCNVTVTIPIFSLVTQLPSTKNFAYAGSGTYEVAVNAQAGVKTYQWYHQLAGGNPVLVGGNSPTMTLTNQRTPQHGSKVWCVITDNANQVITSNQCVNTVTQPIFRFTSNLPIKTSVAYNGTANYVVNTESQAGVNQYTWYQQIGTDAPFVFATQTGGSSSTTTRSNQKTMHHDSKVWCVVTDIEGFIITSQTSVLSVAPPQLYFGNNVPLTRTLAYGSTLDLTVLVTSDAGVKTYQWYQVVNGVHNPVGTNSASLSLPNQRTAQNQSGIYVIVTDNENNSITSSTCVLTVQSPIFRFTTNLPISKTVSYNSSASYSVAVESQAGIANYKWYQVVNGVTTQVGNNTGYLLLTNQTLVQNGSSVYVVVTDNEGNVITSTSCLLTVQKPAFSFITNNVTTKSLEYNQTANFSVEVNAQVGVSSYTWYQKGNVVGALAQVIGDSASITAPNQRTAQNGATVWCVVRDNEGFEYTSNICTLTVAMPYITTNLATPVYHYASPTPKRFTVSVEAYDGTPTYRWFVIASGETVPVEIIGGISSIGETSTLDYVINNTPDGTKRIFCEITFNDGFKLTSETSTVHVGSPLMFSLNLPADGGSVIPGTQKTYTVNVVGGFGDNTYTWYSKYTNPQGVASPTNSQEGGISFTLNLSGLTDGTWDVWCVVKENVLGGSITSVHSVARLISPIEMIYPLQDWMWAPGSNNAQKQVSYFAAVKNVNPPYSFEWRVNGTVAQVSHESVRNASIVTLSDPAITWSDGAILTLKVTDGSGNTKTFSSTLTFSAFGSKGCFDPMPPKAVPCLMSTGGDQLTTRVKDVTYPLNFRYFYLDSGGNGVYPDISVPYDTRTWIMLGSPGDNMKLAVEVGATNQGILPSNEFNLVAVQSRADGWGLPVPIQGADGKTFSVYVPTNIGSDPMSVFFYYIDQSVVPQQRIPVEFGHVLGVLTQSPMSSAVIPDIMAGKEVEVYCAAIDANGRWWVSGVKTFTIGGAGAATDWKRAPYTYSGQTFHQAAQWKFTFKANGTWDWTGNGVSGVQSGDWKTPLGASSSGYSIRRASSSGDPAYATNLNTSWVDLTNDKYITVRVNMPPSGELDNWSYVVSQIEIRNNQTGVIVSGQLNIEAQSVREYMDGN